MCEGTYTFASAGFHSASVVIRDASTGAVTTAQTPDIPVVDPLSVSMTAEAADCGLVISYQTTITGGSGGHTLIRVEPTENVVTLGRLPRSGTVEVSAPGSYTLRAFHSSDGCGS